LEKPKIGSYDAFASVEDQSVIECMENTSEQTTLRNYLDDHPYPLSKNAG